MALRCHWGLICVQRKWDNFFSNSELFTLIYMPMIAASCPTITQHDVLYITVILVSKNRKVFFLPPKYALFLKSCLCSCVVTVCTCVRVFQLNLITISILIKYHSCLFWHIILLNQWLLESRNSFITLSPLPSFCPLCILPLTSNISYIFSKSLLCC